jgi:hypothetical protein
VFDLKNKEFTGVSLDDDLLRIATIAVSKGKVIVKRVQTAKLVAPLGNTEQSETDEDIGETPEDDEAIFGIEEAATVAKSLDANAIDDWDMADDGSGSDVLQDSNGSLFAGVLTAIDPKSISVGLGIPFGNSYLQAVNDVDLKKTSKRKLKKDLHDRLEALYGHVVSDEQMTYQVRDDGTLLLASIESEIPTLRLFDEALPMYPGKAIIRDIIADEAILIGLIRANYELLDHQYTCIVHVEDKTTHVIFMHGKEFHSILPIIAEGNKTTRVVRTIFSKILFEVDRGKVPTLDRIVLTGDTVNGKLITFLTDQFIDVEVTPFEFNGNIFEVDEEVTEDYRKYLKAIGTAWSAADVSDNKFLKIPLIPKYVQVRQQVLKLAWHGFILLALIAITPLLLNQVYLEKSQAINDNQQQIQRLDQQIRENRAIAQVVDKLSAEYATYSTQVALLDTLSINSLRWSRTLRIMNNTAETTNSVWFTSVQADNNRLLIQGVSLYRDRIPRVSNSFGTAIIQQVIERDLRGFTVYEFTLLVTRTTNDPHIFRPEKVTAPDDLLLLRENPTTRGTIEQ